MLWLTNKKKIDTIAKNWSDKCVLHWALTSYMCLSLVQHDISHIKILPLLRFYLGASQSLAITDCADMLWMDLLPMATASLTCPDATSELVICVTTAISCKVNRAAVTLATTSALSCAPNDTTMSCTVPKRPSLTIDAVSLATPAHSQSHSTG